MDITNLMGHFLKDVVPKNGLPAEAYTSYEFWQVECNTIFTKNWVFAGFKHELRKKGDVVPITIAGQPIFLIKDKDNKIVAFHNCCSHRCLKLIDKAKNVGNTICCPYHSWTYNLDGSLRKTPYFAGKDVHTLAGFDANDYGLKSVKIAVWHDWIFVNLDGKAPKFKDYVKPLFNNLSGIDFGKIEAVATLDFGKVATNWKFIMENFIEPYHVQFVHRTTTNQPLINHYTIVDGSCLGSAVDMDDSSKTATSLSVSSRYLTLFPNFIIGRYFPDQIGVYLNVPLDATSMTQKRVIYTTEGQKMTKDELEFQKKLWHDVHKEDHAICEKMQLGRSSPVAKRGGVLSPHWENSVRAFQQLVVDCVAN